MAKLRVVNGAIDDLRGRTLRPTWTVEGPATDTCRRCKKTKPLADFFVWRNPWRKELGQVRKYNCKGCVDKARQEYRRKQR